MVLPLVYPVSVPDDSPVLQNLVALDVEDRSLILPPLYIYTGQPHPHCGSSDPDVRVIVYLIDPTPAGKEAMMAIEEAVEVPSGPIGDGDNPGLHGLIEVDENDYIMARSIYGGGLAENDIVQAFTAVDPDKDDADVLELEQSVTELLGERDRRDAEKVWLEHQPEAVPVHAGERCLGMTCNIEKPRLASGPAAALKMHTEDLDTVKRRMKAFIHVATKFNMRAWEKHGPLELRTWLKLLADCQNAPSIGTVENYMWYSMQLNLALPQYIGDERTLEEQMGFFGGKHRDVHDCVTSLSCALSLVDIPNLKGWEPGRLHLVGLGVYFKLKYLRRVFFSGLLAHGGTSPLAPNTHLIPNWAIRALLISYPQTGFTHGNVKYSLAGIPGFDEPLHFTPEMSGAPHKPLNLATTRTNFVTDGHTVMDDESLVRFVTRAVYQLTRTIFRQLPRRLQFQTDAQSFFQGLSTIQDGQRVPVTPWDNAPSGDVDGLVDPHKNAKEVVLHEIYDRMVQGIPGIPSRNPYPDEDFGCSIILGRRIVNKRQHGDADMDGDDEDSRPPKRSHLNVKQQLLRGHVAASAESAWPGAQQDIEWLQTSGEHVANTLDRGPPHIFSPSTQPSVANAASLRPSRTRPTTVNPGKAPSTSSGRHCKKGSRYLASKPLVPSSTSTRVRNVSPSRVGPLHLPPHTPVASSSKVLLDSQPPRPESPRRSPGTVRMGTPEHGDLSPAPTDPDLDLNAQSPEGLNVLELPPDQEELLACTRNRSRSMTPLGESEWPPTLIPSLVADALPEVILHDGTAAHSSRERLRTAFLNNCSAGVALNALEDVRQVNARIHLTQPDRLNHVFSFLDQYDSSHGDLDVSVDELPAYSSSLAELRHFCTENSVWTSLYRMRVMLAETRLANAVEEILCNRVPHVIQEQNAEVDSSDWLVRLIAQVYRRIRAGLEVRLSSLKFVDHPMIRPATFSDTAAEVRLRKHIDRQNVPAKTTEYVTRVLQCWFDIPVLYQVQARASLVRVLIENLGPGVLLVPTTWAAYDALPYWLFTSDAPRHSDIVEYTDENFRDSYLDDLKAAIGSYPRLSLLRQSVEELRAAYIKLHASTRNHRDAYITQSSAPRSLRGLEHMLAGTGAETSLRVTSGVTNQPTAPRTQSFYVGNPPPTRMSLRIDNDCNSPIRNKKTGKKRGQADAQVLLGNVYPHSATLHAHIPNVVTFLGDAHRVASAIQNNTTHMLNERPLCLMRDAPDFLIPIRELAPSRARVNEDLDVEFLKTRDGLFSLLLFRCISFNTEAFRACPPHLQKTHFRSCEEWLTYMSALQVHFSQETSTSDFFCNRRAVSSRPLRHRTLDAYSICWDLSRKVPWPPTSTQSQDFPVPFAVMMKVVNVIWRKDRAIKLPDFGPLNEYLLVADMCAAGLVNMPTVAEMGAQIDALDKGGKKGLKLLGYISDRASQLDVVQGFTAFFNAVHEALTPDQVDKFQWNTVTAEHSLCKFVRLTNLHCYK